MNQNPHIHTFIAAKGGQGATVCAAALALLHATAGRPTLLIDHASGHDCRATLGLPESTDQQRIETVTSNLHVTNDPATAHAAGSPYQHIVIDAGTTATDFNGTTTLVTRACYLALRNALALEHRADNAILIHEPDRALNDDDVSAVLAIPIAAVIPYDPAIARTIDSGLLTARIPKALYALSLATRIPTGSH